MSLFVSIALSRGYRAVNESTRSDCTSRRFNVGDALILIAACALTVNLLRSGSWFERIPQRISFWADQLSALVGGSQPSFESFHDSDGFPGASHWDTARTIIAQILDEIFLEFLCAVLLGLTLVQPMMRLRSPRPRLRVLVRQSGFVACLAVIVGTLILVDLSWTSVVEHSLVFAPAAALLLLWPLMGLPPWHAEPSWIDRLGRAVGWGWIVATASVTVLGFL